MVRATRAHYSSTKLICQSKHGKLTLTGIGWPECTELGLVIAQFLSSWQHHLTPGHHNTSIKAGTDVQYGRATEKQSRQVMWELQRYAMQLMVLKQSWLEQYLTATGRRIRCDRRVPACANCATAKLQCQGYGLRLSWPRVGDRKRALLAPGLGSWDHCNTPQRDVSNSTFFINMQEGHVAAYYNAMSLSSVSKLAPRCPLT